jgi:hypothetical protein
MVLLFFLGAAPASTLVCSSGVNWSAGTGGRKQCYVKASAQWLHILSSRWRRILS